MSRAARKERSQATLWAHRRRTRSRRTRPPAGCTPRRPHSASPAVRRPQPRRRPRGKSVNICLGGPCFACGQMGVAQAVMRKSGAAGRRHMETWPSTTAAIFLSEAIAWRSPTPHPQALPCLHGSHGGSTARARTRGGCAAQVPPARVSQCRGAASSPCAATRSAACAATGRQSAPPTVWVALGKPCAAAGADVALSSMSATLWMSGTFEQPTPWSIQRTTAHAPELAIKWPPRAKKTTRRNTSHIKT